jgi:hypothetical protein
MSNSIKKAVPFSAKNLVVSVAEMRKYAEEKRQGDDSGFDNISQLSDAKIAEIIGDAKTKRSANYRVSGFVGMSVSFEMQKDWIKATGNKSHKVEKSDESCKLRRYQKSQVK